MISDNININDNTVKYTINKIICTYQHYYMMNTYLNIQGGSNMIIFEPPCTKQYIETRYFV
jgi:hypothetical protein